MKPRELIPDAFALGITASAHCDACGLRFTIPATFLDHGDAAREYLRAEFEAHQCTTSGDLNRDGTRIVRQPTEDH
jgi:hypothetical protein